MIVDHIKNRARYYGLGEGYKLALDFFAAYDPAGAVKEDIVLDGDNVFVKVRPMMSKLSETASYEAHDRYTDIHFVAGGVESIGYAERSTMAEGEYNAEKDMVALEGQGQFLTLTEGYFMITQPQDAHKPAIAPDGRSEMLIKLIAKVKV